MVQSLSSTSVNTLVKGLITEATPLTFPENASVDELNCIGRQDGSRGRRKGIQYESGNILSSFTISKETLVKELIWKNVDNKIGAEFLVVQVGANLYFYDKSVQPISNGEKSFSVSLNTFSAGNGESVADSPISGDSILGVFVVTSKAINPFYIQYDSATDTITTKEIKPKVRDFDWQGNTDEYTKEEPTSTITEQRKYDTYNSGWVDYANGNINYPVLIGSSTNAYIDKKGAWPPLTAPWFQGKNTNAKFDVDEWEKIGSGNTLSGNGHFILDLFYKDRATAVLNDRSITTTISLPVEVETARFTAVAKYAGRIWFTGLNSRKNGSKLFFSPVVESLEDLGKFYQEADPTSEDIADLVDDDGGVIYIPEAINIRYITPWAGSLLVIAENGAWLISGPDNILKATEYSVTRVRGAGGILSPDTFIDADGTPFWWDKSGIYTVTFDETGFNSIGSNITKQTIQSFFDSIDDDKKLTAKGRYDSNNKVIYWLYQDNSEILKYKYNRILIFDLNFGAFYPWKIEDQSSQNTSYIIGLEYYTGLGTVTELRDVIQGANDVVQGSNDVVATLSFEGGSNNPGIKFLVRDGASGKLTFAEESNTSFKDWNEVSFTSYIEAFYIFDETFSFKKNNVYIVVYFNLTETGFTGDETNGYSFVNPSGCVLKSYWDLKETPSSEQQVYRHLVPIVVDSNNLNSFNYPYDKIVTKNKLRGRGRLLKLRFESEPGKDFQLLGYEVLNARNTRI